ncbi:hypothetical protein [Zobellia galactanivorans]|uniref:hypothetical protein n=1 Tax=Zobellia galactanivorans (strain DSM 12802 / CCUG 47099 / CIP 106680 / NCIMB 13871 / Dsij) TaxID=63186 RepID=UPI001C06CA25|nr:hypothetical protein [Zobellia galactanivorans]MBU3024918.1 hypothetical protein [Zobellia galactanivorans]
MKKTKTPIQKYRTDLPSKKQRSYFQDLCLYSCFFLGVLNSTSAQEEVKEVEHRPFRIGAHLKNMHTWHGSVVHPGAVLASHIEYNSENTKFTFGFWGGASFSTVDVVNSDTEENVPAYYKEVSIYSKYRFSDSFFVEAVSHNNYTGVEERGDDLHYWGYDKTQGYNFVDLSLGYHPTPNTLLYFATIINGGSGDYELQDNGRLKNSWTHYFEVSGKVWKNKTSSLSLFAGGAWSFLTNKTFYTTNSGNIINVGATFTRSLAFGSYALPIEVMAMWNPEKELTVLQLDIIIL